MKINPRLREWVAVDNRGQDVAGTNKYQKTRPKTGRWREIIREGCCSAFELVYTPLDVTGSEFTLTITCDSNDLAVITVTPDVAPTVDVQDVVAALNKKAGYVGKFFVEDGDIHLQLNRKLALNCADAADLAFTVEP